MLIKTDEPIMNDLNTSEYQMILRNETPADIEAITEVTVAAFKDPG